MNSNSAPLFFTITQSRQTLFEIRFYSYINVESNNRKQDIVKSTPAIKPLVFLLFYFQCLSNIKTPEYSHIKGKVDIKTRHPSPRPINLVLGRRVTKVLSIANMMYQHLLLSLLVFPALASALWPFSENVKVENGERYL